METKGFWDIVLAILPYLGTILATGWLSRVYTLRESKKKAQGENRDQAISSLEKVIDSLTRSNSGKDEEIAALRTQLEAEREGREAVRNENTAVKMVMCVHMGCVGRKPGAGQGDLWYDQHKNDPALGVDYLPINRILLEAGMEEKAVRRQIIEQAAILAGEDAKTRKKQPKPTPEDEG